MARDASIARMARVFFVGPFTHPRAESEKYQMRNILAAKGRTSTAFSRHPTTLAHPNASLDLGHGACDPRPSKAPAPSSHINPVEGDKNESPRT